MHTRMNFCHPVYLMFKLIICRDAGTQIQRYARSVYKAEEEAAGNSSYWLSHNPTILFLSRICLPRNRGIRAAFPFLSLNFIFVTTYDTFKVCWIKIKTYTKTIIKQRSRLGIPRLRKTKNPIPWKL